MPRTTATKSSTAKKQHNDNLNVDVNKLSLKTKDEYETAFDEYRQKLVDVYEQIEIHKAKKDDIVRIMKDIQAKYKKQFKEEYETDESDDKLLENN